jgi:tellurite resistance protein
MAQLLSVNSSEFQRIVALTNLMKIDGYSDKSEKAFIQAYISQHSFDDEALAALQVIIENQEISKVQLDIIKQDPKEAQATLVLMVALSKEDGAVHELEKKYIYEVAQYLGFSKEQVDNHFNGMPF